MTDKIRLGHKCWKEYSLLFLHSDVGKTLSILIDRKSARLVEMWGEYSVNIKYFDSRWVNIRSETQLSWQKWLFPMFIAFLC